MSLFCKKQTSPPPPVKREYYPDGMPKPYVDTKKSLDRIELAVYAQLKPLGFTRHGRSLHRFVDGDISQTIYFQCGQAYHGITHLVTVHVGIRIPECENRSFGPDTEPKPYYPEAACTLRSQLGTVGFKQWSVYDMREDADGIVAHILSQLREYVLPAFDVLCDRAAILAHRREYPQFDTLNHRLILLHEAMIYGRMGDRAQAAALFNRYYWNCKNYPYPWSQEQHLQILEERAARLDIPLDPACAAPVLSREDVPPAYPLPPPIPITVTGKRNWKPYLPLFVRAIKDGSLKEAASVDSVAVVTYIVDALSALLGRKFVRRGAVLKRTVHEDIAQILYFQHGLAVAPCKMWVHVGICVPECEMHSFTPEKKSKKYYPAAACTMHSFLGTVKGAPVAVYDLRDDPDRIAADILSQLWEHVLPAFDVLCDRAALLKYRRLYPQFDIDGESRILLDEAMIWGRVKEFEKAAERFNQHYQQCKNALQPDQKNLRFLQKLAKSLQISLDAD